jgi:hypothetical protein
VSPLTSVPMLVGPGGMATQAAVGWGAGVGREQRVKGERALQGRVRRDSRRPRRDKRQGQIDTTSATAGIVAAVSSTSAVLIADNGLWRAHGRRSDRHPRCVGQRRSLIPEIIRAFLQLCQGYLHCSTVIVIRRLISSTNIAQTRWKRHVSLGIRAADCRHAPWLRLGRAARPPWEIGL